MIFIDTETTDLIKPNLSSLMNQPSIIEISAIRLNDEWELVSEYNALIKPPIKIPEHITRITGIENKDVEDKLAFAFHYKELCNIFLGEDTVIGHNVEFDLSVLQVELRRLGKEFHFPWPINHVCTVEMSMNLTAQQKTKDSLSRPLNSKRLKLSQLHELATGKPHENAHRAKDDVIATIRCYRWLLGLEV